MAITPEQAAAFQNEIVYEWALEVERVLRDRLRAAQGFVPSATLDRLRPRVLRAAAANAETRMFLSFQDSARIVEMRRLERRRRPIVPDENFILEWLKKYEGRFRVKRLPGYTKQSRVGISREKQLSRLASAIIIAKSKRAKRRRRRGTQWYNKTFYGLINQLITTLVEQQAIRLQADTKEEVRKIFE